MLKLCSLTSLLIIFAQAEFIDSNGAYIYTSASELSKLTRFPVTPVYLPNSGKLQDINHPNGAPRYLYDDSQVNMDQIDTALEAYRYHNPATNVSSFIQNTEANKSDSAELAKRSIGIIAQVITSVLEYAWFKFHSCGAVYKTIGHTHYRIEICTTRKTCEIPPDIIKADEANLENYSSFIYGWFISDHDST